MDFKKQKHFTPKKEDSAFFRRRRSKSINKELFRGNFIWGLKFSSYEIESRNRVTQKDVTLRVTNSKSKNKTLHFELLTRRFNFYFSTFKLLTGSWKIKNHASRY